MVRSLAHVRVRANHALSRRNVFPTPLSPVMMFRREPKLNVNFGAKPRFSRISCSSIARTMIGHQRCANKLQQRRGHALISKIGVHGKLRTARPVPNSFDSHGRSPNGQAEFQIAMIQSQHGRASLQPPAIPRGALLREQLAADGPPALDRHHVSCLPVVIAGENGKAGSMSNRLFPPKDIN